jgi:signal transduction histidine kinase
MIGAYTYNPHLWPALVSLILAVFLGCYSLSRRHIPGARSFAFACLFGALWALGTVLEISAEDFFSKIFWIKFETVWQLPSATAIFCFVLVYAGLRRWLTRRALILLAIPPLAALVLVVTNDYYHLIWAGFQIDEYVLKFPGLANRPLVGYAQLLALVNLGVLLWLAIRSPRHRWPVAIMMLGQVTGRTLFMLDNILVDFLDPGEATLLVVGLLCLTYAVALFRFHVLNPVPLARSAVIEQMKDGMLVLDLEGRIVDLNPAAEKSLGEPRVRLGGRPVTAVLPINSDLLVQSLRNGVLEFYMSLGIGQGLRHYSVNLTPLVDRRGLALGLLLLLHDETDQKHAQSQILEQQRVVATLQERERLARELHDGIGQVLGYASMQTQTIDTLIQSGDVDKARTLLSRLREVVKDTHTDVRESILSLKSGSSQEWYLLPALKQYLNSFQTNYGIHTEISLPEGLKENTFEPVTGVQILRVIQEALTNARKHSNARAVKVMFESRDGQALISIIDDGCGFNPDQLNHENGHFGLGFMRERIEHIGGSVRVESRPGSSTVVKLEVPIQDHRENKR